MDVKSSFLNGLLQEILFVKQPRGLNDLANPEHVVNWKKALCGLKQAPRSWYDPLSTFFYNTWIITWEDRRHTLPL